MAAKSPKPTDTDSAEAASEAAEDDEGVENEDENDDESEDESEDEGEDSGDGPNADASFRYERHYKGWASSLGGRERPLGDLASKLFRAGAEAVTQTTERLKEAGDVRPRDIVSGAASITARGREELAGLVAREVRLYMEKFRIGEELRALMTDHSLEVHASVRLKPVPSEEPADEEPTEDDPDGADSD